MKKIVSVLVVILSLLLCTLAGCSSNNEQSRSSLTTENYRNWLSQNMYISDLQVTPSEGSNTTYTLSCVLNIETVKTTDVFFENVSITYSCPEIEQWTCSAIQVSARVSYEGVSHTSFVLVSHNRMIIDFPQPYLNIIKIKDISGFVLVPGEA